jgi:hypothetical protein
MQPPRNPRPAPEPRAPRSRPDPTPLRLLVGLAGIASASAITSALLPSVTPAPVAVTHITNISDGPAGSTPTVIHVTRTVVLQPGETPPPQASVVIPPTPTPRVHVVTTTRQSGVP